MSQTKIDGFYDTHSAQRYSGGCLSNAGFLYVMGLQIIRTRLLGLAVTNHSFWVTPHFVSGAQYQSEPVTLRRQGLASKRRSSEAQKMVGK